MLESVVASAGPSQAARVTIVLPTFNERLNVQPILQQLLALRDRFQLELIVVDDDSADGTADLVKQLANQQPCLRLIRRVGRSGLSSAIKEGLLDATGDLAVVMDCDGQHEPAAVAEALDSLMARNVDLVIGSRFHPEASIKGLSTKREGGSVLANQLARFTLPRYRHLTDYMSGFFALRLDRCMPMIRQVDAQGFKFLYELLSISRGHLVAIETPLSFQSRSFGSSKLDASILWDFGVSIIHTLLLRMVPRRAVSFALVGVSGIGVQLLVSKLLMLLGLSFVASLPPAVIASACSNYLVNNTLTFRHLRLVGFPLLAGLIKFLIVASLPMLANIGLASIFYSSVAKDTLFAQIAGIAVVFVWNYAASSRFVWNTP
ncbi:glycosyltransferase family 2 protein [Cyanobium sp. Morenito 9A2]|uniref:glycosyltransferase n=1 Tax=Cyanobium sp. Morenito 9A2 TaxID=2823718 RepID=UPI0020CCD79E|nr:glycosyltransferase family 2 protein [Cyanobium sp. Morenito 9A2]MCP9849350.1 glycosyltransferase family 2 protein [Cyanobium sp. Morenito 9A2]